MKTVGRARGVKTVCCVRGVKTVGRACVDGMSSLIGLSSFAGAVHAQDADGQWSRWCEDGGSGVDGVKTVGRARGVKTVGRASGDGTSSLIGLSSFVGAAHVKHAESRPRLANRGGSPDHRQQLRPHHLGFHGHCSVVHEGASLCSVFSGIRAAYC